MVPACSSGTLTNMLPHWNAMPQTQDMAPYSCENTHCVGLLCIVPPQGCEAILIEILYGIMTEELVIREIRIDEAAGRGD